MYMFESIISLVYLIWCLRALKPSIPENKAFIWDLNRSFNFIVILHNDSKSNNLCKTLKYIYKSYNLIMNWKAQREGLICTITLLTGCYNFFSYTSIKISKLLNIIFYF